MYGLHCLQYLEKRLSRNLVTDQVICLRTRRASIENFIETHMQTWDVSIFDVRICTMKGIQTGVDMPQVVSIQHSPNEN